MSKKAQDNGSPVAAAQVMLSEAQAKLAAFERQTAELKAEADRLAETLDSAILAGQEPDASKIARDLGGVREQITSRVRVRPRLVAEVEEAQAGLKARKAEAALAAIGRLEKAKAEVLVRVQQAIKEAVDALHEADLLQDQKGGLAREHGLATPSEQRLLFGREDRPWLLSRAADALRDALDPARAFGVGPQPSL